MSGLKLENGRILTEVGELVATIENEVITFEKGKKSAYAKAVEELMAGGADEAPPQEAKGEVLGKKQEQPPQGETAPSVPPRGEKPVQIEVEEGPVLDWRKDELPVLDPRLGMETPAVKDFITGYGITDKEDLRELSDRLCAEHRGRK